MERSSHCYFQIRLALGWCVAALLCSCRTKPPVVRDFLRMPPECAGGLSGVQRAEWMKVTKRSRKSAGTLTVWKQQAAGGVLELDQMVTDRGTAVRRSKVLRVGGTEAGGLAVEFVSGESAAPPRLWLLERRSAVYTDVTARLPAARTAGITEWLFDAGQGTATGCAGAGPGMALRPQVQFVWNGSGWSSR